MFAVDQDIEMKVTPEDVFDFIIDVRHEVDWNPQVTSASLVSGESVGKGTRFDVTRKGSGLSKTEITEFDRPNMFVMHCSFRGGEYDYTARLEPSSAGTRLHERIEMTLRGSTKLLGGMIERRLREELPDTAQRMRQAVEGQPTPSSR